MGWERKRGKLEEFNLLLRGATDTGYIVKTGDLTSLRIRFVLTLDADTVLPRHHLPQVTAEEEQPTRAGDNRVVGHETRLRQRREDDRTRR